MQGRSVVAYCFPHNLGHAVEIFVRTRFADVCNRLDSSPLKSLLSPVPYISTLLPTILHFLLSLSRSSAFDFSEEGGS